MFRMNEFRSVEWNILLLRKLNFIVPFLISMLNKLKIKARFKWHWLTMDSWNFREKNRTFGFFMEKKSLFGWPQSTTTDKRCCWKIAICVCYTRSCYSTMCIVPFNQLYFNMLQKWLHSAVPNPTKMQNGADLN